MAFIPGGGGGVNASNRVLRKVMIILSFLKIVYYFYFESQPSPFFPFPPIVFS